MANKEKKKKGIRWWGVLLIILGATILLSPIIAGVTLYLLINDSTIAKYEHTPDTDVPTVMKEAFVGSIDDTGNPESPNHGKVHFRLTEQDLNDVLYYSLNNTLDSSGASQYISGYYADITEKNYVFAVSGHFKNIVSTCVKLVTTLTTDVKVDGEDAFVFTIKDAKIGHMSGLASMAKTIISWLPSELDPSIIEDGLAAAGLHMTIDVKNLRIVYKTADLLDDLEKMVGKVLTSIDDPAAMPENFTLFYNILRRVYDDGHFSANPHDGDALAVDFDLSNFSPDLAPDYCVPTASYDPDMAAIDFKSCIAYTKTLLDGGFLTAEDDIKGFITYLAKGYMRRDGSTPCDQAANEAVDQIASRHGGDGFLASAHGTGSFASGIASITGYEPAWYENLYGTEAGKDADDPSIQPFTWTEEVDQVALATALALGQEANFDLEATLDDVTLTRRLHCTQFLGQSFAFPRKIEENVWKVNAFYVDDFYCNFFSDQLVMNIGVSINGFETTLFIKAGVEEAAEQPADGRSFLFRLDEDSFHFGGTTAGGKLGDVLYERVKSAVSNNAAMGKYFALDERDSTRYLVLDLDSSIDEMRDEALASTPAAYQDRVREAYDSASFTLGVEGESMSDPSALFRFSGSMHVSAA